MTIDNIIKIKSGTFELEISGQDFFYDKAIGAVELRPHIKNAIDILTDKFSNDNGLKTTKLSSSTDHSDQL